MEAITSFARASRILPYVCMDALASIRLRARSRLNCPAQETHARYQLVVSVLAHVDRHHRKRATLLTYPSSVSERSKIKTAAISYRTLMSITGLRQGATCGR